MITHLYDLPYSSDGDDVRKIDIFLPGEDANGCAIFFIHGGGWQASGRGAWHAVMEHFCARGYVCGSPGYHFAPEWRFPTQVEDVRLAMSYFKTRAAEFGFSPDKVAVWGSSAGGHLAAMLATIQPEDDLGMTPATARRDTLPQAAVCYCTVFTCQNYTEEDDIPAMMLAFLGATPDENPELIRQASPIDRVIGKEPPFLMITGDADLTTPIWLHEAMRDTLQRQGIPAEITVLPGVGHGYGYGVTTEAQQAAIAAAEEFLARVFSLSPVGG